MGLENKSRAANPAMTQSDDIKLQRDYTTETGLKARFSMFNNIGQGKEGTPPEELELIEQYQREVEEELKSYPKEVTSEPEPARPLLQWEGISYFLDNPAPEQKLLFCGKGWSIPDKCVLALFAAGATGKTFLGFQLSACLATGINFGVFETSRPLTPAKKRKVLYLCGEDQTDIIHRRIAAIFKYMPGLAERKKDFATNLNIKSLVGEDRVLIAFDSQRNPATTPTFDWLSKSIEEMPGVDVLVIDPLSKFFGLDENNNTHGAAWIAALETLSTRHNLAVLFVHHESKQQNRSGSLEMSTGRGAGAFRDNARGSLSMARMTKEQAKHYGNPADWKKLVSVLPTKANYTEDAGQEAWFRREEGGVLIPTDLIRESNDRLSSELYSLLVKAVKGELLDENDNAIEYINDSITYRGLTTAPKTSVEKAIRAGMEKVGIKSLKNDMAGHVLRLEAENKIVIGQAAGGRNGKRLITVCGHTLRIEESEPVQNFQPDIPDLAEKRG